jgi:CRISPR-associated protein Cas2
MKTSYLIAYDITNERRLNRTCRYLKGKGLHLQKSVFFCVFSFDEVQKAKAELTSMIDPVTDDIRIYPVLFDINTIAMGDNELFPPGISVHLK